MNKLITVKELVESLEIDIEFQSSLAALNALLSQWAIDNPGIEYPGED
jgi:hypothetical protein